jgi:hypothetical protein
MRVESIKAYTNYKRTNMQSQHNQELDHSNQYDSDLDQLPSSNIKNTLLCMRLIYIIIDHWQQNDDNNWIRSLLSSSRIDNNNNSLINTSTPPSLPPLQTSAPSLLQSRYYPSTAPPATTVSNASLYQHYATLSRSNSYNNHLYSPYSRRPYNPPGKLGRSRLTTTLWEDESTLCYQVDCQGICVARRQGMLLE